ncbi:MAG: hypothetical protein SCALA702_10350 [Melioribacteraceae bacterium]|nr:MAG: hypothetical protein SCALA702_10350 [Melioribacteraceae bacterium]
MYRMLTAALILLIFSTNTYPYNTTSGYEKIVKIAAFDYYPAIFKDSDGTIKGMWVDLLNIIAEEEKWKLEFVYGSWNDGLDRIKTGEVDVVTSAARTPDREKYMDFCDNFLLTVWTEVYVAEGSEISDILDLEGTKIGLMHGDYNALALVEMCNSFRVNFDTLYFENYFELFEAINKGVVDAGSVNNMFGSPMASQYNLHATSILLNPFDIFFTVGKDKNKDILSTLDAYLYLWKTTERDEFHEILDKWAYSNVNIVEETPQWVITVLMLFFGLIVVSIVFVILLNMKVKEATRKLRESEERFNLAMNATNDGLFDWDLKKNTIIYSPRWKSMLGYEDYEVKNEFSEWERLTEKKDVEESWRRLKDHIEGKTDRFEMEFKMRHKDGHWVDVLARANALKDKKGEAVRVVGTHVDISRQKIIEKELAESLDSLVQAQKIAGIGNFSFDPQNRKFFLSKEIEVIFEWGEGNKPKTFTDLFYYFENEDKFQIEYLYQNAVSYGEQFDVKLKTQPGKSRFKWIHIKCKTIQCNQSDNFRIQGTIQDITRERLAEIALIESEENYRNLYNNIPLGVFRSTIDGRLISANQIMVEMYGYKDKNEFLNRAAQDFYSDNSARAQIIDVLKKDGYINNHITNEKRKDGSQIWVKSNYRLSEISEGVPVYIDGVVEDITKQKQQEDSIIQNEQKYRNLYNRTPVMLHSINASGRLVSVSDYWLNVMGYSRDEVIGRLVNDFSAPEERESMDNKLISYFPDGGEIFDLESKMIRKNGTLLHVSISAITEKDESGSAIRALFVMTDITERKKAEVALKEREELFRHSFDHAATGMCLVSPEGKFVRINKNIERMLGYTEEELIGRHFNEITFNDDIELSKIKMMAVYSGETTSVTLEKRYLTKNKEVLWAYVSLSLLRDNENKPLVFIVHILDVTDRKNSEIELRRSVDALKQAENISNLGYVELNWKTKDAYWSEGMYKLLQADKYEKPAFADGLKFIHPDELIEVMNKLNDALKGDDQYSAQFRVVKQNGEVFYANLVARIFYDENKEPDFIQAVLQDITDKVLADRELLNNQKLLDSIIENMPVMITRYDSKEQLLAINAEMIRLTGYTPEEAAAPDFLERVYPDKAIREAAIEYMNKATIEWKTFPVTAKNGEIILSEWSNIILKDGIQVGIGIDIRERKNAEKAIIENQRLSAIGEMASAVAHDFNNALQSIFGNIELALFKPDIPKSVRKYLETIRNSADDASARVKLLQRFGGKTRSSSEFAQVNLNSVAQDVIVQSRPLWKNISEIEGRHIKIKSDLGNVSQIAGNESELRAVLYNTVKNSIESIKHDGEVKIYTRMNGNNVEVLVEDNGSGMDENVKARIFQPFFSTKGFEMGRGLGMSGAYSIINEHKGTLAVEFSEPGKGTTIKISLPAIEKKSDSDGTIKKDSEIKSVKVLWIDDEPLIRGVAGEMLETLGHTGKIVESGEEALKILEQEKFDLIVTDLGMPGMNGWELVSEIRGRYGEKPGIGVLTGWGTQIEQTKLEQNKIQSVLGKPFKINQLKDFLAEIIR